MLELTEKEKAKKLAEIQRNIADRKLARKNCANCFFYKDSKTNYTKGRCLKVRNGIKNQSNMDFCGDKSRTIYCHEIHECFVDEYEVKQ